MSNQRVFTIGKNTKIPSIGLGTWQSPPGMVRNAVKVSLQNGYRHIDAAWVYGNEQEVGEGIKDSGIKREDIFITSKLWNSFHSPADVEKTLNDTLKKLDVSYLDLYLMHWPVAFKTNPSKANKYKPTLDMELTNDPSPTWKAMEELVKMGKIRHIGVSNFTIGRVQQLLKKATIKPVINQVELNLYCAQPELLAWSKANNILLESYSPLGSTGAPQLSDPVVMELAKKHNVDAGSILINWQVCRGVVCLPKSVTESRIISNFTVVELSKEEVERLEKRAVELGEKRTVDPSKAWGVDIFHERPGESKL